MIVEDLYRGKYAPIESMTVLNDHDSLPQFQEKFFAALRQEKRGL